MFSASVRGAHTGSAGSQQLLVLTWLQQEPLDGHIEEPLEPLVLLFGAQDFALVLHHRLLHGAEDLLCGRCQPVVQKHVQQLQFGHVFYRCLQRWDVLLFTSTNPEVQVDRLLRAVSVQRDSGL